ncbi:hypothetical protein MANES_01G125500v8 [Manihot esculenta]|uniref:Uncharacterized protein n=1 Tax=Manihot esculenta TaxID=3983 RepID=A0ACB7IC14_MANES|nr:hypothetical protein MANES_01G125500v8 [Manihot esculenta]
MGARKLRKKGQCRTKETASLTLHSMVSAIESPEGPIPANMKKLYAMLVHLSLTKPDLGWSNSEFAAIHTDENLDNCVSKLNFKAFHDLSDILFKELDRRFEEFFSALRGVSGAGGSGRHVLLADIWAKREELMLLLRCCMVLLILMAFNQSLLIEKGRLILSVLSRLISIELTGGENEKSSITFKRSISLECAYLNVDCTANVTEEFFASISSLEPSDSCYTLLCGVLEVFTDELLVHKSLREYFMLIDFASSRNEMLFNFHFGHGNLGCVLEVVCAHFILSVSDEPAFVNFINRLFWCHKDYFRVPEISLPAALSLLLNPVMLSAPKMFQAHLILLVSEVIGICAASEDVTLNVRLMDWYLTALERSVVLYTRLMSTLHVDSNNLDANGSFEKSCLFGSSQPTFESFLLRTTVDKIYHLIAKSKNLWASYLSDMSCGTDSDLVAVSIAYVKENLCISDESYKDEILSVLNSIILGCSSDDINGPLFQKLGEASPQDLFLLASILKLMSSSMLQAIWYLKRAKFSGSLKSHGDVSSCKEYEYIVGVLGCFQHFSIHLPIQNFLYESMQSHPVRHKESKWMLLHLSGLLSLTYVSGIDFLVKGCLFTMMTLLNWFLVEECDLSALFDRGSNSCSSKSPDNVEGDRFVPMF